VSDPSGPSGPPIYKTLDICDDTPIQKWNINSKNNLVNMARPDVCLDKDLIMNPCGGDDFINQKWYAEAYTDIPGAKSNGLTKETIIGLSVGGGVLFVIIVCAIIYFFWRKKNKTEPKH
jgi:hypothetical protein